MLTIIECANCGQKNQVELVKLKAALCGKCKEKLLEDNVIPAAFSDEEISTAVETAPSTVQDEINTDQWTHKIGDFEQQEEYVKKGFWSKVKKYASKVPFALEAVAMYYCAIDPSTPKSAKVKAMGALAYWILPTDLIPDFIPVAGFADDATAIFLAYKSISPYITDEHRAKAEQFFSK